MYVNVLVLGTALGSVTDEQGRFTIPNLPEGMYIIEMRYIGYAKRDTMVDVLPGEHCSPIHPIRRPFL